MNNKQKWRQIVIRDFERLQKENPNTELDKLWEFAVYNVWVHSIAPLGNK